MAEIRSNSDVAETGSGAASPTTLQVQISLTIPGGDSHPNTPAETRGRDVTINEVTVNVVYRNDTSASSTPSSLPNIAPSNHHGDENRTGTDRCDAFQANRNWVAAPAPCLPKARGHSFSNSSPSPAPSPSPIPSPTPSTQTVPSPVAGNESSLLRPGSHPSHGLSAGFIPAITFSSLSVLGVLGWIAALLWAIRRSKQELQWSSASSIPPHSRAESCGPSMPKNSPPVWCSNAV